MSPYQAHFDAGFSIYRHLAGPSVWHQKAFHIQQFNGKGGDTSMKRFLLCIGLVYLLSFGVNSVWAHDFMIDYNNDINQTFELGDVGTIDHFDQDDGYGYAGSLSLTITNTGDEAWGDFHFYSHDTAVKFTEFAGYPNMFGAGGATVAISEAGDRVDFEFYSDPVYSGETVTFGVYTDNTAQKLGFFQISIEATPVPVPAAVWLLGSGLIGLVGFRRKK
jgi:hypothetical protein